MICTGCEVEMKEWIATKERPYHYHECGLDNVYLIGISVYRCSRCETDVPNVPREEDLSNVIADHLVKKRNPLCGKEIKFLRMHAGFSGKDFAALLHMSPVHLSRIENGRQVIGGPADKLARVVGVKGKDVMGILRLLAQERLGQKPKAVETPETRVRLDQNDDRAHWRIAA